MWRDHLIDVKTLAVIFIFFLAFFWRVFFAGDLPLIRDPMAYSYPLRAVAWEMIRSGSLPLWTPYIFSGYPLLSMAQLGLGYPVTWVYALLPGHWAETVYVLAPFLFAPAFLYAYVRTLGRSRIAALLAGLSFTYGGMMASKLSNGMLPNAVMWLPLLLIAIERARTRRFIPCLVAGTGAYAMSVLTGIAQGFVVVGLVAVAYACFVTVADWRHTRRRSMRPLAVAVGGIVLAAGVAAFQILETLAAFRLSVRNDLNYDTFGQLSLPMSRGGAALWIPLYYHIESAPYLTPIVLALALVGVVAAVRRPLRHHQALFWFCVALVSAVLMLGTYTSIYRVVYHIPILNKFRGPSRHSFEWTLALSILAAYGWDALTVVRARLAVERRSRLVIAVAFGAVLSVVSAGFWWRAVIRHLTISTEAELAKAAASYSVWKIIFVATSCAVLICAWRLSESQRRTRLIVGCFAWVCFVEAYLFMAYAWGYPPVPAAWFTEMRSPTRFLKSSMTSQERVYLRVVGFGVKDLEPGNLDFLNLAARYKLQNIAGYEPLISRRYSRALGDVWLDGVRKLADRPLDNIDISPDLTLFDPRSHVLDILNSSFVAGYTNLEVSLPSLETKEDIPFAAEDLRPADSSGKQTLTAPSAEGDTLAVVSTLAYSTHVQDGTPVARLRIYTTDGRIIERALLAGSDTAEWAHERPDVQRSALHRLAPVFASYPGDERNSFPAYRYWTRLPLGGRVSLDRIEVTGPAAPVTLQILKATLYDSEFRRGTPLMMASPQKYAEYLWLRDSTRWEVSYARDSVVILKNRRAMPRAWLVSEAEAVVEEDALKRIRGESAHPFDPWRTALLEVPPEAMPPLASGSFPGTMSARVALYEPNRLLIEARADHPGILVLSEMSYPGWEARLDGKPAKIFTADYLLRAVAMPAGEHQVEMRYTAPGARRGAIVSVCTLLLLGGMVIWSRIGR